MEFVVLSLMVWFVYGESDIIKRILNCVKMASIRVATILYWQNISCLTYFSFFTDLDVPSTMAEARSRWLRPNEIHALLSNYKYFNINVKPVNLPKSNNLLFVGVEFFYYIDQLYVPYPYCVLISPNLQGSNVT